MASQAGAIRKDQDDIVGFGKQYSFFLLRRGVLSRRVGRSNW